MGDYYGMAIRIREKTNEKMKKIEKKTKEDILKRMEEIIWAINWAKENYEEQQTPTERKIINSVAFERIEDIMWWFSNE